MLWPRQQCSLKVPHLQDSRCTPRVPCRPRALSSRYFRSVRAVVLQFAPELQENAVRDPEKDKSTPFRPRQSTFLGYGGWL